MPKLLSIPTNGKDVLVEVKIVEDSNNPISKLDTAVEKIDSSLNESFKTIALIADSFQNSINLIKEKVSSAEVQIGFQFTSKGSIYIVESEAHAAIKVKLIFHK